MPQPTFHSAGDGRGRRSVHVNGNEITHVLWCDTEAGVVVFVPQPIRVKRTARDEVYTRRLRGQVTVVSLDGEKTMTMTKKNWMVTIPGHQPFPITLVDEALDHAGALAFARSIWSRCSVE